MRVKWDRGQKPLGDGTRRLASGEDRAAAPSSSHSGTRPAQGKSANIPAWNRGLLTSIFTHKVTIIKKFFFNGVQTDIGQ